MKSAALSTSEREALRVRFEGRVRLEEPMSRHTSWHVGGPAELFFEPRDRQDLGEFLRELPTSAPITPGMTRSGPG